MKKTKNNLPNIRKNMKRKQDSQITTELSEKKSNLSSRSSATLSFARPDDMAKYLKVFPIELCEWLKNSKILESIEITKLNRECRANH